MRRRRAQFDALVIPQLVSILPHIFLSKFCLLLLLLLLLRVVLLLLLLLVVVAGGSRAYCPILSTLEIVI